MKNLKIFTVAALVLAMASCEKKTNDGNEEQGNVWQGSVLEGEIASEVSLVANTIYDLKGNLIVKAGGALTIPAGTKIEGSAGFESYILVLQGGKIFVNGTAEKPVVMTAKVKKSGEWGGLIVNGKAPISGGKDVVGSTEINKDFPYGGTEENDNSGAITYLVLGYTGAKNSADTEHNGLTLNAVGRGTKIENVFVHDGADDGIEFYGGTVNVTNLLVVNSDDDMFDFTQGYTGTLKNAYGLWDADYSSAESDPCGIEADGNLDGLNAAYTGQSNFTVENMTIDLRLKYEKDDKTRRMLSALKIRRGATATVKNALLKGTGHVAVINDMQDKKGGGTTASAISITNALETAADNEFACNDPLTAADYPNVKIVTGNTGCATGNFSWTGYKF